jgi:hypothetical protein
MMCIDVGNNQKYQVTVITEGAKGHTKYFINDAFEPLTSARGGV